MTVAVEAGSIPLFLAEAEAFGGAERSLLALSRWLHEHGRPNHILTYRDEIKLVSFATHPVSVIALRPDGGVRSKIAALRRALPPGSPRPIVSGYQPALHCTLAGVRGFHTLMHDTPSLFGDAGSRTVAQRLRIAVSNKVISRGLRSGGVTTVNSVFLQAECLHEFGVKATVVRMGGLPVMHAAGARAVDGTLRMLSVCRLEPNKRIDWILHALHRLMTVERLSERTDWHLHLVGTGSQRAALTALAARLGMAERVSFHGFIPDEMLETFYEGANLFVMPAVQGYGIPALEALQRGIPVLLHRESGVSDLLLETPWATVMTGGEASIAPALAMALDSVLACRHCDVPRPELPTEESWAEEAATLFGYGAR